MKKRIIASTMASVMALSGAASALVASADLADIKTEAITKSQLKKFIEEDKEVLALIYGGLEKYGANSGDKFLKSIEYATAVVEDGKATADDATVAFQMIKAAMSNLVQHDKVELQLLVAECTDTYNTENELNEAGDRIYKDDFWSVFESAYINGLDVQDSDDIQVTTGAWDELHETFETLKKNKKGTKTKSEIVKARKAYESALALEFKYQPWQRGSVSGSGTKYDGVSFAWGILYEHIASGNDDLVSAYNEFDAMKGVAVTSNETIVDAVKMMDQAAKVLTGFSAKMESGGETQIKTLLKTYSNQLVYTYKAQTVANIVNSLASATVSGNGDARYIQFLRPNGKYVDGNDASIIIDDINQATYWNVNVNSNIVLSAELDVKVKNVEGATDVYYVLDKNVKLDNGFNALMGEDSDGDGVLDNWFWHDKDAATAFAGANGLVKTLTVGKPFKLSNYIGANVDDVIAGSLIFVRQPAAEKATLDNTLTSVKTAVDNLKIAVGTLSTNVDALTSADMVTTKRNAVMSAISSANAALEALKGAISVATDANATPTDVDAVKTAYDAISAAVARVKDADYGNCIGAKALAAAIDTADVDAYFAAAGDYTTKTTAYKAAYSVAVMDVACSVDAASSNSVYDKDGENFSKAFSYKYDRNKKSFTWRPYSTSKAPGGSDVTTASLPAAMQLVASFRDKNWDGITKLDNINTIVDQVGVDRTNSKPRSEAWNMLYNYLKYALEDMFKGSSAKTYTLQDVKNLIEKAYTLAEETAETAMFKGSHVALVKDRTGAVEWVKLAEDGKKAKTYIENFTDYSVSTRKTDATAFNSTGMYSQLNTTYAQLSNEKKAFKYSYGEIIETMAKIARKIDAGEIKGDDAAKLKKDLSDAALKLMTLGSDKAALKFSPAISDENPLFKEDGTMNKHNRLFTYGGTFSGLVTAVDGSTGTLTEVNVTANGFHEDMKKAYEKLTGDYEAIISKPVDQVVDDVNGDTKFDLVDVQELLKLVVSDKGEVAKHDFKKDGKVDMQDVQALLTKWVSKS